MVVRETEARKKARKGSLAPTAVASVPPSESQVGEVKMAVILTNLKLNFYLLGRMAQADGTQLLQPLIVPSHHRSIVGLFLRADLSNPPSAVGIPSR